MMGQVFVIGGIKNYYMTYVFIGIFSVTLLISVLWVRGIDNMKKNHPDYKGEDFLDWGKDEDDENYIY